MIQPTRFLLAGVISLATAAPAASAQSLLDRPPNLSGDWVGAPGTLYFHFVHRFVVSKGPEHKVTNIPTFLLGAGLPKRLFAGINYSTNSRLAADIPNESELFVRWSPIAEDLGAPLDLGGQVGYNTVSDGVDGEISAAKRLGRARFIVAGRVLSNPFESGKVQFAIAGGGTIRLGQYVALAGDIASMTDRDSTERVAWSAGLNVAIPLTPHTFSLQATNAPVGTLQGVSRGSDKIRYGFEFTIPLTLRRYFGKRAESPSTDTVVFAQAAPVDTAVKESKPAETAVPSPVIETAPAPAAAPVVSAPKPAAAKAVARVRRTVIKNISYMQPKITITAGTTIEWTNNDPLPHSVTAVDRSFNSGLIQPGRTYRHTFTKAGRFNFYCMPHPFMKGVIVVE